MKDPKRFWQAFEEVPGFKAVPAEWERWLGIDYPWVVEHLLRPTGEIASTYPAEYGEPYRIVDRRNGRYRAVHEDGGAPIDLARKDVTVLGLDVNKLAAIVCRAFGFVAEASVTQKLPAFCRIGNWLATDSTSCPVWLGLHPDEALLHERLLRVAGDSSRPVLLITLSPIDDAVDQTLKRNLAWVLPLSEAVDCSGSGAIRISPAGKRSLAAIRRSVVAVEVVSANDDERSGGQSKKPSADQYEWAAQAEIVRATNQVLGEDVLNKGVLSRECTAGHIDTNRLLGRARRVRVSSFLAWVRRQHELDAEEVTQIRNAIIGEIASRSP